MKPKARGMIQIIFNRLSIENLLVMQVILTNLDLQNLSVCITSYQVYQIHKTYFEISKVLTIRLPYVILDQSKKALYRHPMQKEVMPMNSSNERSATASLLAMR